jgi:hypothetical protein
VSWLAVLALGAAAYGLKLAGAVAAGRATERTGGSAQLEVVVVPVLAGLIVVQTLGEGRDLVLDARLPAVALAALLVWRRVPLLMVVLAAGATAALLHHAGL